MITGVATTTRLDLGILEQVFEAPRELRRGKAARKPVEPLLVEIAEPLEAAELVEVPREIRAPGAEADLAENRRQSFHILPSGPFRGTDRVPEVDDEPCALGDPLVVDPGVGGHDDDAVRVREQPSRARRVSSP